MRLFFSFLFHCKNAFFQDLGYNKFSRFWICNKNLYGTFIHPTSELLPTGKCCCPWVNAAVHVDLTSSHFFPVLPRFAVQGMGCVQNWTPASLRGGSAEVPQISSLCGGSPGIQPPGRGGLRYSNWGSQFLGPMLIRLGNKEILFAMGGGTADAANFQSLLAKFQLVLFLRSSLWAPNYINTKFW